MENQPAQQPSGSANGRIAAVVIGRNEGERLHSCLQSLRHHANPVVYVDSGSADGSVTMARTLGVEVVELDISRPFTAARARNAGYARVRESDPDGQFVQFIDGDCDLDKDWFSKAQATLDTEPDLAIVCGRRREKYPEASLWNHLVDIEWNSPVGEAKACGGDAFIRRAALDAVNGYREDLIAGEEPEMCFRMRAMGWRIRRIEAEMTRHDADMMHISQWWQRCRRAGYTYAEGAAIHGKSSERYRISELRRTLIWGVGLPFLAIITGIGSAPLGLLLLLIYPLQIIRLRINGIGWSRSIFLVFGKFAEVQGVLDHWGSRLSGRRRALIEYK